MRYIFFLILLPWTIACKNSEAITTRPQGHYQTRNVVVVVIDGPRFTETWGSPTRELVPYMEQFFAKEGVINDNFYNAGPTYTNAGHASITTGRHQQINNIGQELPREVSFFQRWRESTGSPSHKAWIVTSKDKLNILADTKNKDYAGKYKPETNCGRNGPNTGYRQDSTTLRVAKAIFAKHQPNLMLINFKEPDSRGHGGDWLGYLKGIKDADSYVFQLWEFLQADPYYRNKTTLIVTNDHGRHLDGHADGFVSHGDNCTGCRHINFYTVGPDFRKGLILSKRYNQTDIPVTIAELMNFDMQNTEGSVMWELFEKR